MFLLGLILGLFVIPMILRILLTSSQKDDSVAHPYGITPCPPHKWEPMNGRLKCKNCGQFPGGEA